jgi:Family of unknown function (DUF6114)/zinc-ribbon domain
LAEYPTAAFILSLLGGIFSVIGGFLLIGIGALIGDLGSLGGLGGLSSLTGGLGNLTGSLGNLGNLGNLTSTASSGSGGGFSIVNLGELGVLMGIATIALAVMILKVPQRHQLWGALVLTFSILSIAGSLGGLLLGFILGIIGGVLAISWKPSAAVPAAPPPQVTRICPNCGTVVQRDSKFCSYCGKSLP